jgi:hypothetical protein
MPLRTRTEETQFLGGKRSATFRGIGKKMKIITKDAIKFNKVE